MASTSQPKIKCPLRKHWHDHIRHFLNFGPPPISRTAEDRHFQYSNVGGPWQVLANKR